MRLASNSPRVFTYRRPKYLVISGGGGLVALFLAAFFVATGGPASSPGTVAYLIVFIVLLLLFSMIFLLIWLNKKVIINGNAVTAFDLLGRQTTLTLSKCNLEFVATGKGGAHLYRASEGERSFTFATTIIEADDLKHTFESSARVKP